VIIIIIISIPKVYITFRRENSPHFLLSLYGTYYVDPLPSDLVKLSNGMKYSTVDPWLSSPCLSGTSELKVTVLLGYFKFKCMFY